MISDEALRRCLALAQTIWPDEAELSAGVEPGLIPDLDPPSGYVETPLVRVLWVSHPDAPAALEAALVGLAKLRGR
jgi:hypothetical protein